MAVNKDALYSNIYRTCEYFFIHRDILTSWKCFCVSDSYLKNDNKPSGDATERKPLRDYNSESSRLTGRKKVLERTP